MRLLSVLICAVGLLISCSSSSDGERESVEVRVDTYNVNLAGALSGYEEERREQLHRAIANAEADILCLQEVWEQADKDAMRDALMTEFPYAVYFFNDIDDELDDATDQNGQIPPARSTVPCPEDVESSPGVSVSDEMDDAIDCIRDACSTIPGSDEGRATSRSCAQDECLESVLGLVFGNEQQQRCYTCIATQLPTETFGRMRETCPTLVNQLYGFRGQNDLMIVSRYPLKNEQVWLVPGGWGNRAILSATAELPNGSELDLFCNHLIVVSRSQARPYTGQYGNGKTGPEGWEEELFLQTQKLIARVESVSQDRPAIILGDMNSGHAYPAEEVFEEAERAIDLLESSFTPAYTDDYVPLCTYCNTNPLNNFGPERSRWIDHILLHNLRAEAVKATQRTFDDDEAVDVGDGVRVPMSDHYGLRSVIEVP